MQKPVDAFNQVASGTFLPVYLLTGPELYLKEEFLRKLCLHYRGSGEDTKEVRRFEGRDEDTLEEAIEELKRRELFTSGNKIAIFRNPPLLEAPSARGSKSTGGAGSRGEKKKSEDEARRKEEEQLLSTYWEKEISREIPGGILVLWVENCDRRKKPFKMLDSYGAAVDCSSLKGEELKKWVKSRAKKMGKNILPAAVEKLILATEGDMLRITRELEKVDLYLKEEEKEITPELVEKLVPADPRGNIFSLVDGLGEGDLDKAYRQLKALYMLGEPPVKILHMIVRHFRLLLSTVSLQQQGYSSRELHSVLQVHPFVSRKLSHQSGRFTVAGLRDIYRLLQQTDLEIKSGRVDPHRGIELLMGKLAQVENK